MSDSVWSSHYRMNYARTILISVSSGWGFTGVPHIFLFFDLQLILIFVIMLPLALRLNLSAGTLLVNKLL